MQTQTLEHAEKWQEVRAEFVRKHGEDYASYLTRLAGHNVPYTDEPQCGLYGLPLDDGIEGVTVNFHPKNGHIACQSNGKAVENWQPLWPLAFKHILKKDDYENLQKTGHMPCPAHGDFLTRGQYEYLKKTGRMPYAAHAARVAGKQVDLRPEDPDPGWYWVKSPDKSRARPVCYDVDKNGDITCVLDRAEHRRALPQYTENRQGYANLWEFACKNPLSKDDYDRLVETGLLPGESPAAAADRGNVVSINASNGATLVPTADGAVTTTHNQPPEDVEDERTFEALTARYKNLKAEGDDIISRGAAKNQNEANSAGDLSGRVLKRWQMAEAQRKAEKAPHDLKSKEVQVKWKPLLNGLEDLQDKIGKIVVAPFLKAEDARKEAEQARLKAEQEAQIAAGATPAPLPTQPKSKAGSGLGRSMSLRTNSKCKLNDRVPFILYLIEHSGQARQEIDEMLQKFGDAYARAKTDPVPPGIEYVEEQTAV